MDVDGPRENLELTSTFLKREHKSNVCEHGGVCKAGWVDFWRSKRTLLLQRWFRGREGQFSALLCSVMKWFGAGAVRFGDGFKPSHNTWVAAAVISFFLD